MIRILLLLSVLLSMPAYAQSWTQVGPSARGLAEYDNSFAYVFSGAGTSDIQDVSACSGSPQFFVTGLSGSDSVTVQQCSLDPNASNCSNVATLTTSQTSGTGGFGRGGMRAVVNQGTSGQVTFQCVTLNEKYQDSQWQEAWLGENEVRDTDGNGLPDSVIVNNDYNQDGLVNGKDVQDAVDSLTDTNHKYARVTGNVEYGTNGVGTPDDYYNTGKPGATSFGRAVVILPDDITLECDIGTVIAGWGQIPLQEHSIITPGNRSVVKGCTLDGKIPETPTNLTGVASSMGMYSSSKSDVTVTQVRAKNLVHSGFYFRNGSTFIGRELRCDRVGSYVENDAGGGNTGQPCVYVFAQGGQTASGAWCFDCVSYGSGSSAFNARREDNTAVIENVNFIGFYAEDTWMRFQGIPANQSSCVNLRGVNKGLASDGHCVRTAGVATGSGSSYDNGTTLGKGQVFRNILIEDSVGSSRFGPYTEDVTWENLEWRGFSDDGISCGAGILVQTPNKGMVWDDIIVEGCTHGIEFQVDFNGASPPTVGLTSEIMKWGHVYVRRTDLEGLSDATDYYDAIHIDADSGGTLSGLYIEQLDMAGHSRSGIRVNSNANVQDLRIMGGYWDGIDPGFQGRIAVGSLPTCNSAIEDQWYYVTGGNCPGGSTPKCRCVSGSWEDASFNNFRSGIAFQSTNTSMSQSLIQDVKVCNYRSRYGITFSNVAGNTGVRTNSIEGCHDGLHTSGGEQQIGAITYEGTNVSNMLANPPPECRGTLPAGNCLDYPAANDLGARQEFVETSAPSGPCTSGQKHTNTTSGVFSVCETSAWAPK